MSYIRLGACAAMVAGVLVASAHAQSLTGSSPGFHYFHQAGAGMEQHDADLAACAVATRALVNGSDVTTGIASSAGASGGFAGGFLGALIGGVIDNNEERQGAAANTENCMAVRGWSVIGLPKEEGRAMEEPDDPASIHAKLAPLVDAAVPAGPVLRGPFANELAVGNFTVGEARDLEEVSLSVRAVRDLTDAAIEAAGELKPPKPQLPEGVKAPKTIRTMKAADLASADASKSYVVLRMIGGRLTINSHSLLLARLNADGTEVVYDGAATLAEVGGRQNPKVLKGEVGEDKVYDFVAELPPGLWKLAAINHLHFAADLCLGAPAFEIKAGETLFLGVMSISESGGYPITPDLEAAKKILAGAPALAEKVKAPDYTNGFLSDCFGSYAYAYEIPGAPFIDMDALARTAARDAAAEAVADAEASDAAAEAVTDAEAVGGAAGNPQPDTPSSAGDEVE